jgi:hypothetical protein
MCMDREDWVRKLNSEYDSGYEQEEGEKKRGGGWILMWEQAHVCFRLFLGRGRRRVWLMTMAYSSLVSQAPTCAICRAACPIDSRAERNEVVCCALSGGLWARSFPIQHVISTLLRYFGGCNLQGAACHQRLRVGRIAALPIMRASISVCRKRWPRGWGIVTYPANDSRDCWLQTTTTFLGMPRPL